MLNRLATIWPLIVTVAVIVAAVTSYWLKILQIRALNHKIRELEQNRNKQEQRVHIPTDDEISRYGKAFRYTTYIAPFFFVAVGALAFFGLFLSRHEINLLKAQLASSQQEVTSLRTQLDTTKAPLRQLRIVLTRPDDGAQVVGPSIPIEGKVSIFSMPGTNIFDVFINNAAELVVFVRPISTGGWWLQSTPELNPDGTFHGTAFLGSNDCGREPYFEIIVLASPKYSSRPKEILNLPYSYAQSSPVKVRCLK